MPVGLPMGDPNLMCITTGQGNWASDVRVVAMGRQETTQMQALTDFLTTDYGVLSGLSILAMLCGLGYFLWYVNKHIKEDTARHDQLVREGKAT